MLILNLRERASASREHSPTVRGQSVDRDVGLSGPRTFVRRNFAETSRGYMAPGSVCGSSVVLTCAQASSRFVNFELRTTFALSFTTTSVHA